MRQLIPLLASLLADPGLSAQSPPVFRAEVGLVVLQATVRNKRGELVTDLERSAFRVYENGDPQTITLFRHGDVPISLGILLDNSRSMRDRRPSVEAAALTALSLATPQDEAFVMNFADKAHVDVRFTSDLAALQAGVARLDSIGGTAMRDAIAAGEEYLRSHATRPRKALLVITDGNDNASTMSMDLLKTQAEQSEVLVYAVGLLSEDDPGKAGRAREALDELTASTGGRAYYPATREQADAAALDIARQMRHLYTIGYSPLAQALDGSYRKLRVVARRPEKLIVTTRAGYRATRAPAGDK